MRATHNIVLISAAVLLTILTACAEGEVYYRFHQIGKGQWFRDSTLVFTMDSLDLPPGVRYDVTIELTTSGVYPYRDLWLQIDHNLADTVFRSDTMHYQLADGYGKWLGSGVGGLHQLSLPFLSAVSLDRSRKYKLGIGQIMNDDPLTGIEKAGLKVMATNPGQK